MAVPYSYELNHDPQGRIIEKTEIVAGEPVTWTYAYDKAGRLAKCERNGWPVCDCWYDRAGRRTCDSFPKSVEGDLRRYEYDMDNRLSRAGKNSYMHDDSDFRSMWNHKGKYTLYEYSPDYHLLKADQKDAGRTFTFRHDDEGRRIAKYCNGELVEAYEWLDFIRLAGYWDGRNSYEFAYEDGERTPYAMHRDDGAVAYLFHDQVGSLRVVADTSGNVIKAIQYDPFGGIIEDSNPGFKSPLGFAGGLHDRDLGFVRFGFRDYDTYTSRWTAPDPIGDAGGDSDWYGYCLDDPVNGVDPLGLFDITWGDVISTASTIGIEAAKQAGNISKAAAGTLGIVTAPIGDLISPSSTNEGNDTMIWKMEAARDGYLDVFDTEEDREKRKRLGELDAYRKGFLQRKQP